ncbi:uncharacterized protein LOC104456551 isoform X2 [Eucalyptus grandis]|uniref:uncharacterized protein LOC104456551 isoform X2 n=1 Tax=Eucalyptus grandis TaxID=71139 RepID=UPI00192EA6EE|nr:uncharacterized protein LOC104456551 isoform X2 [Eucalyptus grandis]
MQILQWLFRVSQEQAKGNSCSSTDSKNTASDQETSKGKSIVLFKKSRRGKEKAKPGHPRCASFAILCRKDVAKACFYSTINLRRLSSLHRRQNSIHTKRMKKEDVARGLGIIGQKADSGAAHGGNKVLPISDTALTSSATSANDQSSASEKKEKVKGDKAKVISRMKELIRWAAASKAEKGGKFISRKVLQFRQRGALKAIPDDDQFSNESPKISFRWDVESCSTISTSYSAISLASARIDPIASRLSADSLPPQMTDQCLRRKGNWITTDSEFVVLEL